MFRWGRVPLLIKVLAALLSFSGLSYRESAFPFFLSHESVRLWCAKVALALLKPEKKLRECSCDESKMKLRGYLFFIWIARDVNTKEVLNIRLSYTRSSFDAYLF